MTTKPIAPQIDFAKRHIVESLSTFNAASAMYRLDVLLDDIAEVKNRLKTAEDDSHFHPWAYEFSSYYTVGFITCLEWHARSRLYDLYVYDPKVIEASDIKQSISDSKLMQMLSENLTVAQLIAGSTNVSSIDRYIGIFVKILDRLGSKTKVSAILDGLQVDDGDTKGAEALKELYDYRNKLVHEIDLTRIGHYNIRDMLHFDDAIKFGELCRQCMRAMEDAIRLSAPPDFPNLLGEDYYPIDLNEIIKQKIQESEINIEKAIEEGRFLLGLSIEEWRDLSRKSVDYLASQTEMLENLEIPGVKYHDPRPNIERLLLDQRLEYLNLLKKEFIFEEPLFE